MMKPTITLISDWHLRDPYLAMFKGDLFATIPDINVLDITHNVEFFNLSQTAFLMRQCYRRFPEGSVHLILTNISNTSDALPVVLYYDNHYFISEDNGIFFLMFGKKAELEGRQMKAGESASTLSNMLKLAQAVLQGKERDITTEYKDFKRAFSAEPMNIIPERTIEGEIIYIDAACNAVTNIPTQMFKDAVQGNSFTAFVQSKTEWKIQKFQEKYVKEEGIYFTNNALEHIEITIFQGDVAMLASMNIGDKVVVKY